MEKEVSCIRSVPCPIESHRETKCTVRQTQEILKEDKSPEYRKRRQQWFSGLAICVLSHRWVLEEIHLFALRNKDLEIIKQEKKNSA